MTLVGAGVIPAQAGKNSAPAPVMMVATMPPTFTLQAAQATLTGASGTVQTLGGIRSPLLIRGQLRGHGGTAVVRIPISLAANTRSFVVEALSQGGTGHTTIYLGSSELMARPMATRRQTPLALGLARNRGREFFTLDHPVHCTLEIVFQSLPPGQPSNFRLALSMRDLGY